MRDRVRAFIQSIVDRFRNSKMLSCYIIAIYRGPRPAAYLFYIDLLGLYRRMLRRIRTIVYCAQTMQGWQTGVTKPWFKKSSNFWFLVFKIFDFNDPELAVIEQCSRLL
jgi:hypothetical protein